MLRPTLRSKTSGPVSARLLTTFLQEGRNAFTLREAQEIIRTNYDAVAKLMTMMIQRGLIARIKAGTYMILQTGSEDTQLTNWPVIARALAGADTYFISYYSAMRIHGMTSHPLIDVYLTLQKRRSTRKVSNIHYHFIYCKKEHFWGATSHWATKSDRIQISDLERTLLDAFDRPDLCGGLIEVVRGLWGKREEIHSEKLIAYAHKFRTKAAVKRLGYILETLDTGSNLLPALSKCIAQAKDYVLLDPQGPKEGRHISRWRIRLNVPVDEVKASVWG